MFKRKSADFEFETTREITVRIKVKEYTPGRPAPACSNPSSPAYGDCGDDPEIGDVEIFYIAEGGVEIEFTKENLESILDDMQFDEEMYEKAEDILYEAERENDIIRGEAKYDELKENKGGF